MPTVCSLAKRVAAVCRWLSLMARRVAHVERHTQTAWKLRTVEG